MAIKSKYRLFVKLVSVLAILSIMISCGISEKRDNNQKEKSKGLGWTEEYKEAFIFGCEGADENLNEPLFNSKEDLTKFCECAYNEVSVKWTPRQLLENTDEEDFYDIASKCLQSTSRNLMLRGSYRLKINTINFNLK